MTSPISNTQDNQVFSSRGKPSVNKDSESPVKQQTDNATSAVEVSVNIETANQILEQENNFNTHTSLTSIEQAKAAVAKLVDQFQQNPQQAMTAYADTHSDRVASSL